MKIANSLQSLQKQKIKILEKEIKTIENVLNFFEGYKTQTIEAQKEYIKRLKKDIDNLKEKLQDLKNDIIEKDINEFKKIENIIFYNYIILEIEEILKVIEALYLKMNQLFGEMMNQYLPYPTFFGRRYSNSAIMIYLNIFFNKIYKTLTNNNDNNIILTWSHKDSFKYKILRNREIKRENYDYNTYNNYIDLPYWYYDLPFLLPSVTHEIVSLSIRKKSNSKIYQEFKNFSNHLSEFFNDNKNRLVYEIGDILGYNIIQKELAIDLFSDIIAYNIHGVSYFYALFHNLLGQNLAKNFIEVEYRQDDEKIKRHLHYNEWYFSPKKDHNFFRLYLLYDIASKDLEDTKEIKDILNLIMPLDNSIEKSSKRGFVAIYANSLRRDSTYLIVHNYLRQLLEHIKLKYNFRNYNFFTELDKNEKNNDFSDKSNEKIKKEELYKNIFNNLWNKRFYNKKNNIYSIDNDFRKEIHTKVSGLTIDDDNTYVLILRKVRKDRVNKKKNSSIEDFFNKMIKNLEEQKLNKDDKVYIAYGIYDFVILRKIQNQNENQEENQKLFYFDSKSILMRVKGRNNKTKENEGDFSLILNIELKKNINKPNGYEDLQGIVDKICKKLDEDKVNYTLYKSLGPKDLTLIVEYSKIQLLYKTINNINEIENINRAFSIFCTEKAPENVRNDNSEGLRIVSYLRLPKNDKKQLNKLKPNLKLLNLKKYKFFKISCTKNDYINKIKNKVKNKAKIYRVTGVMDLKLEFNTLNLNLVFEIYKEIIPYITDYQTKIEKQEY